MGDSIELKSIYEARAERVSSKIISILNDDRKEYNRLNGKIVKYTKINAILAASSIVLMIIELLVAWDDETTRYIVPSDGTTNLKILISVSTLLHLWCVWKKYQAKFNLFLTSAEVQGLWAVDEVATLYQSPLRRAYFTELILCAFHLPPFLDWEVEESDGDIEPFITDKYNLIIFVRVYLLFDYVLSIQDVQKIKFKYKCMYPERPMGFFSSPFFGLKNMLNLHTFKTLFTLIFMLWTGFAFAIMCAEREKNHDFNSFENSLWFVMVTMTTCGYGDFYPEHDLSRTLAMLAAFCGLGLTAIVTGVVVKALEFTTNEREARDESYRLEFKYRLTKKAASLITKALRYKHIYVRVIRLLW